MMKTNRSISVFLLAAGLGAGLATPLTGNAQNAPDFSWDRLPTVTEPRFRSDTFLITRYGARTDGLSLNTRPSRIAAPGEEGSYWCRRDSG